MPGPTQWRDYSQSQITQIIAEHELYVNTYRWADWEERMAALFQDVAYERLVAEVDVGRTGSPYWDYFFKTKITK